MYVQVIKVNDMTTAHRPVPVTSDMELSVMKNKIAELKAQLNKDAPSRERSASSSGDKEGFTFVSFDATLLYIHFECTMYSAEQPPAYLK